MENTSLSSDVWNNVTASSSEDEEVKGNIPTVDTAFKVINSIVGVVGVLDNLFVIIIFIFFSALTLLVGSFAP